VPEIGVFRAWNIMFMPRNTAVGRARALDAHIPLTVRIGFVVPDHADAVLFDLRFKDAALQAENAKGLFLTLPRLALYDFKSDEQVCYKKSGKTPEKHRDLLRGFSCTGNRISFQQASLRGARRRSSSRSARWWRLPRRPPRSRPSCPWKALSSRCGGCLRG